MLWVQLGQCPLWHNAGCLWEPPPNAGRGWDSKEGVGSAGTSDVFLRKSYFQRPSVWDSSLLISSVTDCVQAFITCSPPEHSNYDSFPRLLPGSLRKHNDLRMLRASCFNTAELQKERVHNLHSPYICSQITFKAALAVGFQLPSERSISHLNNVN